MRIAILVNVMDSSEVGATTYRLAADCVNRGHEVWITSPGNFCYDPADRVVARGRTVPDGKYASTELFLSTLNGRTARESWIALDDFDVLLLRNNPSVQKAWAQDAGIEFSRLALRRGVIVLNDPAGLARAMNKLYLQTFPECVRPRTLVTRHVEMIEEFMADHGTIIVKPLQGSGGKGVFILRSAHAPNLEQIVESIRRDGYVIAQEYLPAAAEGDTRLFVMNGVPLRHKGKYAAFRRVQGGEDIRSNIHAGGRLRRAEVDDTMLRVAEGVRPRLVEDGMFLVGLDIVGDKLMEINVFSPGGFGSAEKFEKVNFTEAVIDAMDRKVQYMRHYRRNFSNIEMATL